MDKKIEALEARVKELETDVRILVDCYLADQPDPKFYPREWLRTRRKERYDIKTRSDETIRQIAEDQEELLRLRGIGAKAPFEGCSLDCMHLKYEGFPCLVECKTLKAKDEAEREEAKFTSGR